CSPVVALQSLSDLSLLPERTYLPSGEKATDTTLSECPVQRISSRPNSTSQTRTVRSAPPETMRSPVGEKLACAIRCVWPTNRRGWRRGARPERCSTPPPPAETTSLPSGEVARQVTGPGCSAKRRRCSLLSGSQRRTPSSSPPVSTSLASGV